MNYSNRTKDCLRVAAAATCSAAILIGTGCSESEVDAILSGVEVVAGQLGDRHFDALVHATSLGMYPHAGECYFEGRIPADVVFDMVYNPIETLLCRRAGEQGRTVIPGWEMFIEQAVEQFQIWTGETAPRAVMERAALEALGHGSGVTATDL